MTTSRPPGGSRSAPFPHLANAGCACSTADRIIDTLPQALIVLDERLRVIFANRSFYGAFAVVPEEAVGRHLADIGDHCLHAPAFRRVLGQFQIDHAAIENYEIEIEQPALGKRVLLLNAEKIHGVHEATYEIVMTIDDVTERRRAETALKSAAWHAERANLSKSRFLAAANHELRQPLQALSLIRGSLAKSIKDQKNEEALKLVARLNATAGAVSVTLDTLLNICQLEAGIVNLEKVDFPIDSLLEQLRIEFAYYAQMHGLACHVVPCRLNIWSDPRLLGQMIRSLLLNAVRFAERGKILLGCRRQGDNLRIEIWNTGQGIEEDQLHAIFAEFDRLGNSAHERGSGPDLDLSIATRLGNLLGHSVDVYSFPGEGSAFIVEVPLGREQSGVQLRRRHVSDVQASGSDAVIAVIEDDSTVRETLEFVLARAGYRTAAAVDGNQALALVRATVRPDLVVADYNLPNGLTGIQIIADVRKTIDREIPAIILTGDMSVDATKEIARWGCVQGRKPVSAHELAHLIRSLLAEPRQPIVLASVTPEPESKCDMPQPTIFVIDDEGSVREAMRQLLQEEGWSVEVYSSSEAFIEAYRPGREGCLVVDAQMPRMSGLELLERLKAEGGGPPAIMITGHADIRLAVRAMKAGAMAFLEKPVQYDELIVNIERALELARNSAKLSSLREAATKRIAGLTSRERQVVELVVQGNPNKQIAYVLGLAQRTVETHRATAMKKIGARSLSELIHLTIAISAQEPQRPTR